MKKEDLDKFYELKKEFDAACVAVAETLSKFSVFTHEETGNISFADRFIHRGDDVFWDGDEYWSFGGHEYHSGYFPIEYLSMSEKELLKAAEKEEAEYQKELRKKEEEKAARQREKDLAQYLKLKEQFEK